MMTRLGIKEQALLTDSEVSIINDAMERVLVDLDVIRDTMDAVRLV